MGKSSKQIQLGAVISYMALAVNIAATLVYMPWMVSVIGKANYAMYTLAISFVNMFVMDFGLGSTVSKFISQYRAEGNAEKEEEYMATIAKLYIVLDVMIACVLTVLFFFIDKIYVGLTTGEIETFRLLYLIVASHTVISFPFMPLSGVMYAYEQLIEMKLCEMGQKLFSIGLVVLALMYKADVVFVVLANVISALCTLFVKCIIVKKGTKVRIRLSAANMAMVKQVAGFTVWVAIQAVAQRCVFSLAPTILGVVATSEDIALFAPASSIESYFASVAAAVNGFFIMRVTKYLISDEKEKLFQLMLKVGRFQVILLGMIFVVFLCVGDNFMCAWMGVDFRLAAPCAALIMIPDILIFSEQVANTAAIADNLVKYQALGYIIMAVVCVGLSFPLSAVYGVIGAAIAIAAAYAALFVYNNILYSKKLGINMWKFLKECYGRLIIPVCAVGIIGHAVCNRLIGIEGWAGVVVKGAVVGVMYIAVVALVITSEERNMILGLFRKRKGTGHD